MSQFPLRLLVFSCRRSISSSARVYAKVTRTAKVMIAEPEPVRDTKLLVTRCCGLNKFVDQEDPILKPDSEYPEWLWSIHVGKPKRYFEMDPDTKEYWISLRKSRMAQRNLPRKGIRFYRPPKDHELDFVSRLPLKAKDSNNAS